MTGLQAGPAAPKRTSQFLLPETRLEGLLQGIELGEVSIAISQIQRQDDWTLPLGDLLTLAAICKHLQPRSVFEIGTYTGSSTLVIAMNTPSATKIFTLDWSPPDLEANRQYTVGSIYQGTPHARRIKQLSGNSLTFEYGPFYGSMDLVFIDGDHSYDCVRMDTENAFKLLRPGGIIIWDDYLWDKRHPECAGVTRCLNELYESKHVFRVAGTRFAIYLDGWAE